MSLILAIESSCDEMSIAILKDQRELLCNVVASQIDTHRLFGGVVPEIASREHILHISYVVKEALDKAKLKFKDLDYNDEPLLFNARQLGLLKNALNNIIQAKQQASKGQVIDIIAIDIQSAYKNILEILGQSSNLNLLDNIFSKFCLGK